MARRVPNWVFTVGAWLILLVALIGAWQLVGPTYRAWLAAPLAAPAPAPECP